MDNPQERLFKKAFDLGRFVCSIETEGHITISWSRSKKNIQLMPRVGFCNSDKPLIDEIKRISYDLDLGVYVHTQSSGMYRMDWQGMKRVKKLLDLIIPYLVIKRKRAYLVREFCEFRLNLKNYHGTPYGEKEKELFFKVRELNGKARIPNKEILLAFEKESSETNTPNTQKSEDRVQLV